MNIYPIFRLAISLAAGIFIAGTFTTTTGLGQSVVVILLALLVVLGFLVKSRSYAGRWLFGVGVSSFLFLAGIVLTECAWKRVCVDWETGKHVYQGVVQEALVEKQRTYQCCVEISQGKVLLYLPKDSLSASLQIGDSLCFYTRIDSPLKKSNGRSFDYGRYLLRHGISGTSYVPADAWQKMGTVPVRTMKQEALFFRERVVEKFRQWGIGEAQLPVLSALTLGCKAELDKEVRHAYSVAGISHVLALSGMHIAILWLLLDYLLRPLAVMRLRWLKWLAVTLFLWGFAFITGLEASVVRAVVMCMLMELGRVSGTRALSMNALSVTAFFMLLYHPFYLFDVGFQLSFVAVASILLFDPLLFKCISVQGRLLRWLWGTVSVSVVAQLGTAPLVMYYFSNFSIYFLLSNVIAAVLVPFIIYVSVLMVVLSPFPIVQSYLIGLLDGAVAGLNGIAVWTSGLPYASFSVPVLHPIEILFVYGLLGLGWMYWKTRRRKWLIKGLLICVILLGWHLCLLWRL